MDLTVNCIKCSQPYKTDDPDPYYCDACLEAKRVIAAEVDRKMAANPVEKTKSHYQMFDELSKTKGRKGFVNAKDAHDLGIL